MNAEDHQLITDCLRGRTEAFGILVQRYQDRLFNAVYRYLGSAEDAQDVVQESFLSAYQALDGFKGGSRFFTWLYRIAMNHAIDLKRKKRVLLHLDRQGPETQHPIDPASLDGPGQAVEQRERDVKLREALAALSPEHRMALILKDLEGMKYEEMAEVLGVPIGTVRSRLHRARLELRQILEQQEQAGEGP